MTKKRVTHEEAMKQILKYSPEPRINPCIRWLEYIKSRKADIQLDKSSSQ